MRAATKLFRGLLIPLICLLGMTPLGAEYAPLPRITQIDRAATRYSQPRAICDNSGDALTSIESTRAKRTSPERSPLQMITRPLVSGGRISPDITALAIAAAMLRRQTAFHRLIRLPSDDGLAALA